MKWDSNQYLQFEAQRTQPAEDLARRAAQFGTDEPKSIVDIGCGPGNSTEVLARVFPRAEIQGIDSSPDMIEKAVCRYPHLSFRLCGAEELEGSYDLLFSNACLQWVPEHHRLIPALMTKLNRGGVLAVQLPMNGSEPLYRIIETVTAEPQWGFSDTPIETNMTLTPSEYFAILSGCSSSFDMWETRYYHPLPHHRALVEWVRATRLRPYLARLDAARGAALENEMVERARQAYPVMAGGEVLLGFRRFFFTAVK